MFQALQKGSSIDSSVELDAEFTPSVPQIRLAVEAWNPRTDPVPLHQWLFPWLEHLAGPLEEVYPGVRQKLAAALTAWDPYDGSAKALLQPWQRVSRAMMSNHTWCVMTS